MIMKRTLYIRITSVVLILLSGGALNAQWEEKPGLSDRLFFGGNFGLQFGTVTNIEISPLVGYRITPRLSGGLGIRYQYYKDNRNYLGHIPFDIHIYSTNIFTRYMVIKNINETIGLGLSSGIFAQVEYEVLSLEKKYFEVPLTFDEGRFYLHSILIGGGIYQPIGRRSGFSLMVLWNLNETASSPYSNPIIRIGVNF